MQDALKRGMESLSQAEVGSALQVYFNLGELKQVRCLLQSRQQPSNAAPVPVGLKLRAACNPLTASSESCRKPQAALAATARRRVAMDVLNIQTSHVRNNTRL